MSILRGHCDYEKDGRIREHKQSLNILPDDDRDEIEQILRDELAEDVSRKNGKVISISTSVE